MFSDGSILVAPLQGKVYTERALDLIRGSGQRSFADAQASVEMLLELLNSSRLDGEGSSTNIHV